MNSHAKSGRQLAVILLFSLITISSTAAPSWNGSMGMEDGWPLVNNPSQPMEGDQTIVAEEVWRLGHEEDEQEMIFGLIADGLVDEEGITYLLDSNLTTIYKIASDGQLLDNLGREGDGPGEFRNVMNMILLPDGNLGIFEMMPGRISVLDRDGQPRPSFPFSSKEGAAMNNVTRMAADKNSVVIGQTAMIFGDGGLTATSSLARYASDGSLIHSLFSDEEKQDSGQLTLGNEDDDFTRYWAMDHAGRVVVFTDKEQYRMAIFGTNGAPEMLIRRSFEQVHRTDKEIQEDKRQQEQLRKRFVDMDFPPIPKMARNITDVFGRPNGDLWVENSQGDRDRPGGSIGYFDVFNQDGKYTKRVLIEADYDPERDNFKLLGNNLLIFKEAQKAPPRTATSGGGGMQMIMVSGVSSSTDEDEDEEPRPFEVIFYRLP